MGGSAVDRTSNAEGGAEQPEDTGPRRFEPSVAVRETAASAPALHRPRSRSREHAHAAPPGNAFVITVAITSSTESFLVLEVGDLDLVEPCSTQTPPGLRAIHLDDTAVVLVQFRNRLLDKTLFVGRRYRLHECVRQRHRPTGPHNCEHERWWILCGERILLPARDGGG